MGFRHDCWEYPINGKYRIWKGVLMPIHFIHEIDEKTEVTRVSFGSDWKRWEEIETKLNHKG